MKVNKSLENTGIILKGTTTKFIREDEGFLEFFGPLLKTGLRLMKNVLTPLAKSVLVSLGLTTAASATNAANQKKFFWLWVLRT